MNRISRPLNLLAEHATILAAHDFSAGLPISADVEALASAHRDEIGHVAASFIYMERTLLRSITTLKETTAARERIETELTIAHDIQMSIVPNYLI